MIWGATGDYANAADRLATYVGDRELVLAATSAWNAEADWGVLAVTTERVLFAARGTECVYTLPIEALSWIVDRGNEDDRGREAALVDLERDITVWVGSAASVTRLDCALSWALVPHRKPLPDADSADTQNIMDDYARFSALKRAHKTGAIDDESMREALARMFLPMSISPQHPPNRHPPQS